MRVSHVLSRSHIQKRESVFISIACAAIDTITACFRILNAVIPERIDSRPHYSGFFENTTHDLKPYDRMTQAEHNETGSWGGGTG